MAEDGLCTFTYCAVCRSVDLHALFDDIEGVHEGVACYCCAGAGRCWILSVGSSNVRSVFSHLLQADGVLTHFRPLLV